MAVLILMFLRTLYTVLIVVGQIDKHRRGSGQLGSQRGLTASAMVYELSLRAISSSQWPPVLDADAVNPLDSEGKPGSKRPSH